MPEMFSSWKALCSGWMESGFVSQMMQAQPWHWTWCGSHRFTGHWQALDCRWKEKRLGIVKSDRLCWRSSSRRSRLREADMCTEFSWECSRVTTWESKSSTSRGRSKPPCSWSRPMRLSELAQVTAKRPELHISRWPAYWVQLPPGKRHSWGPVVFLPFSATPSEGMSPDTSHPRSRSWGKEAEAERSDESQHGLAEQVLPRCGSRCEDMDACKWNEGGRKGDRVREDMDLLLNQCYLNTWKDVIPRGSERCSSRSTE